MKNLFRIFLIFSCYSSFGQFSDDAIMVQKKGLFINLSYSESRFDSYWEKDVLYKNPDLGKIKRQSAAAFVNIGLAKRINVFASIPYYRNSSSLTYLNKEEGIQDLSGGIKLSLLDPVNPLAIILSGTVSKPMSKYSTENQIFALGMGSKTISGKLILQYKLANGLYVGANGGYLGREIVEIDKDVYTLNNELKYTNKVAPPDAYQYATKLGFDSGNFLIEVFGEKFNSLSGDNIGYNQLPYITNKVNNTQAGIYSRFQKNQIGFNLKAAQVLAGLNTPKALNISLGVCFSLNGKNDRFEY